MILPQHHHISLMLPIVSSFFSLCYSLCSPHSSHFRHLYLSAQSKTGYQSPLPQHSGWLIGLHQLLSNIKIWSTFFIPPCCIPTFSFPTRYWQTKSWGKFAFAAVRRERERERERGGVFRSRRGNEAQALLGKGKDENPFLQGLFIKSHNICFCNLFWTWNIFFNKLNIPEVVLHKTFLLLYYIIFTVMRIITKYVIEFRCLLMLSIYTLARNSLTTHIAILCFLLIIGIVNEVM